MYTRRDRMIDNVSTRSILHNFLNNNDYILAAHARNRRKTAILTGKYLMKQNQNVECIAYRFRLQLH